MIKARLNNKHLQSQDIDQKQKSGKQVKIDTNDDNLSDEDEEEEEEDEDEFLKEYEIKERTQISPMERQNLLKKLANEYVSSKMNQQRLSVKIYQWMQNMFTEKILFKFQRNELE